MSPDLGRVVVGAREQEIPMVGCTGREKGSVRQDNMTFLLTGLPELQVWI